MDVRPTVIVADDNRTNLLIVERSLSVAGFDTVRMSSGEDVVERFQSGKPFDAAVIDVFMPGIGGQDAVSLIRKEESQSQRHTRVPLILMSGDDSPSLRDEAYQVGADAFLTHPLPEGALAAAVRHLIRMQKQNHPDQKGLRLLPDAHSSILRMVDNEELLAAWKADVDSALGYMTEAVKCGDAQAFREQLRSLSSASLSFGGVNIREFYDIANDFHPRYFSTTGPIILRCLEDELQQLTRALEESVACKITT
ncbi:response regulator [Acidisoma sp. 7E03]